MAEVLASPRFAAAQLVSFFQEAASQPFAFGEWDCAMTLANWVRAVTGVDPAPELRGAYASEWGWKRIVIGAGGLVQLVANLALAAGLDRHETPLLGDIGVVRSIAGPAGAIWAGKLWVSKLADGVTGGQAEALAIWGF